MESSTSRPSKSRGEVYYWKCDRPAAFHGVLRKPDPKQDSAIREKLSTLLEETFPLPGRIDPACGEGSHRTFIYRTAEGHFFVRVEDGPEGDTHLEMESAIMAAVAKAGIPVPQVFFCDASRRRAPFAVQVITHYDCPDLNRLCREKNLPPLAFAEQIGQSIARWQGVPVQGFGPFQALDSDHVPVGFHDSYAVYFSLHLDRHLRLLESAGFLSGQELGETRSAIQAHARLLELSQGCLVHKDLALWNILGTQDGITAFIDWDDAIAGDPTDDLSLLACFYGRDFLLAAIKGYESTRPLPPDFLSRFWLHMLRNMIVKAVIRSGAGYFERPSGNFLMGNGQNGPALRELTREKLLTARRGLLENRPITYL